MRECYRLSAKALNRAVVPRHLQHAMINRHQAYALLLVRISKYHSPASRLSVMATAAALLLFSSLSPAAEQHSADDSCSAYSPKTDDHSPDLPQYPAGDTAKARVLYLRSLVVTAHDHCYAPKDFREMQAGGITARTIKLTTDNVRWEAGKGISYGQERAGFLRTCCRRH